MERSHTNRTCSGVLGRQGDNLCSTHNRPLDAYCCTDNQVICADCATRDHTGHTFGLVREERRRKQDDVIKLKMRCQEYLRRQERKLSKKAKIWGQIEEKARETEDFCEAVLTTVIDLLQAHYMSIRELVQAQVKAAESVIQAQEQRAVGVKRKCSELDRLVHTDSDVHFLLEWPTLRQRCEQDLREFTDNPLLPFESIQNFVETFGNEMEEFCNNGFAAIKQNAAGLDHQDSGVTQSDHVQQTDKDSYDHQESDEITEDNHMQQNDEDSYEVYEVTSTVSQPADPQTREDFLQYACDLTMDPSTAHEDLLLSPDLKEVRLAPQTIRGPAVRYPERFIHRRQVLCKEGLHAEHCYYEIKITGGKAELALAYKGINRKSRFRQSAFGGNANSWSLDCTSDHYSVSHEGDSVQLTTAPGHHRIGVYLKFREGTVSFYEVSEPMKFLYKLEDSFTEPLYPGFWVGDNCCIRICDLRS